MFTNCVHFNYKNHFVEVGKCRAKLEQTTTECEYYSEAQCAKDEHLEKCNTRRENCEKQESGKRNHCYVLWTDDEHGKTIVKLKVFKSIHRNCFYVFICTNCRVVF